MNYHSFIIEKQYFLQEYYKGKSFHEITRLDGQNVSNISCTIPPRKRYNEVDHLVTSATVLHVRTKLKKR